MYVLIVAFSVINILFVMLKSSVTKKHKKEIYVKISVFRII